MAVRSSNVVELDIFRLRRDQKEIAEHPARFKIVNCGRRYGKSTLVCYMAIICAMQGGRVAWVVPDYKNARAPWRLLIKTLRPLIKRKLIRYNKNDATLEFTWNEGWISLYTTKNIDSIVGDSFHLVVVDEAAQIDETDYEEKIRPTVADVLGHIVFTSTPRGKNWYYRLFKRGDPEEQERERRAGRAVNTTYRSWKRPSNMNPSPNIRAEMIEASKTMNRLSYRQEWEAEFIDAGGEVFTNIERACEGNFPLAEPVPYRTYLMSVDPGRSTDPMVIGVWDVKGRRLVWAREYWTNSNTSMAEDISEVFRVWRPAITAIEQNTGIELIETLGKRGIPVQAFLTTNETKIQIVDKLSAALEAGSVKLIDHEELKRQLLEYQCLRTPNGRFRYAGPKGGHDDWVMMAMIGYYFVDQMAGSFLYSLTDCARVSLPREMGNVFAFTALAESAAYTAVVSAHEGQYHIHDVQVSSLDGSTILSHIRSYPVRVYGVDTSTYQLIASDWLIECSRRVAEASPHDPPPPFIETVKRDPDVGLRVLSHLQGPLSGHLITISRSLPDSIVWSELLNHESPASDAIAGAFLIAKTHAHSP